jgi:hypothetical protein
MLKKVYIEYPCPLSRKIKFMRRFCVILAVLLAFKCFSYDEYLFCPQGHFTFGSKPDFDRFYFEGGIIYGVEKNQQKFPIGSVEKLSERTRAYVFKVGDMVISTHRSSLLSAGTLFDCLKIYEIYDGSNQLIGFIEGVWDTNTAACFFFYKENHELFAKATLDLSSSKLTISSPDDEILITGGKTLRTSQVFPNKYYWKIKKEKEHPFNICFLWPFIGFLSEVWWH